MGRPQRDSIEDLQHCLKCQMTHLQTSNYVQLHIKVPQILVDFISMNLIGPFKMMAWGNQYALTVMYVDTYVICVHMRDKLADTVVSAYLKRHILQARMKQKNLI